MGLSPVPSRVLDGCLHGTRQELDDCLPSNISLYLHNCLQAPPDKPNYVLDPVRASGSILVAPSMGKYLGNFRNSSSYARKIITLHQKCLMSPQHPLGEQKIGQMPWRCPPDVPSTWQILAKTFIEDTIGTNVTGA